MVGVFVCVLVIRLKKKRTQELKIIIKKKIVLILIYKPPSRTKNNYTLNGRVGKNGK
jgi:hypothetical protein